MSCGPIVFTLKEMPVFKPNKFFWENHWDGKEPKWEAYARAVRLTMAEHSGLLLCETSLEAKVDFKYLARGKPIKKRE